MLRAYRFALDPTPAQARVLASHCGAARKAFNEGLAHVRVCLDQRAAERSYGVPDQQLTGVPWTLPALRRWWNLAKDELAPWWADNSKESYNSGLDALARGLQQWSASRSGKRAGARVGFPRFKSRRRARLSCRFTTGAIRVDNRSHVVLPRIGRVKTHEPVRALSGKISAGTARIMSATISFDGRRWYCAFTIEDGRMPQRPAHIGVDRACPVVGMDAGVRDLLVVAAPGGTEVARVAAPRALAAAQARLRALQRRAARQVGPDRRMGRVGSNRWQRTTARAGRLHARAADLRRDALHQATTRLAQRHTVIVIEDLNVAGMMRRKPGAGKGGRGLNRALADASLGELRRQLSYKTRWYGSQLVVADRWYPSSKTCSACGAVKTKLTLADRTYHCEHCSLVLDRDLNAAINLARLSEHTTHVESRPAGSGPVTGRGAIRKTSPPSGTAAGGNETSTPHSGHPAADQTGTALRKEKLPDHEPTVDGSGNGRVHLSATSDAVSPPFSLATRTQGRRKELE
jgi:putative transposase